jgi:hypothetical protein
MPPHASPFVTLGFAVMALVVAALFVVGSTIASRRSGESAAASQRALMTSLFGVVVWMSLTFLAARSGVLARFDARPPPFLGIFVGTFAVAVSVAASRAGRRLGEGLPMAALVGAQAFRLPLELLMHQAASEGVMPPQMSFGGYNFDIVTGITAIGVAALAARDRAPRGLLLAWNALGLTLLVIVVGIAFASTPMIHAFGEDPAHVATFVAYPPFVWLPTMMVAGALVGHIVMLRELFRRR